MSPGIEKDPAIDRPICILGTGRSGTTLFFRVLSQHPHLGWFSNFTNKHPRAPWLAAWSRILDLPVVGPRMSFDWRLTPKPREANRLLAEITEGVFSQPRRLTAADALPEHVEALRASVRAHLGWQGKKRFLHKHTGFPRIDWLTEVFPDARFIHVARDGRAVVNSMVNVSWWDGTMDSWWWGDMDAADQAVLESCRHEPAVLAGVIWKTLMDYIADARASLPADRFLEIRYDGMVRDPRGTMARVLDFCGLPASNRFDVRVSSIRVHDFDDKWKKDLGEESIRLLQDYLAPHLEKHGFPL